MAVKDAFFKNRDKFLTNSMIYQHSLKVNKYGQIFKEKKYQTEVKKKEEKFNMRKGRKKHWYTEKEITR